MRNKLTPELVCHECGRDYHDDQDELKPGDICTADSCPANQEAEILREIDRIESLSTATADDTLAKSLFNYLRANIDDLTSVLYDEGYW